MKSLGLKTSLGGITIPSRVNEPERIRKKQAQGVEFFTSQVMFDSNDLVWLIQRLNGSKRASSSALRPSAIRVICNFSAGSASIFPRTSTAS